MLRVGILLCGLVVSLGALPGNACAAASPVKQPAIRQALNVRYWPGSGPQLLDVFAPADQTRRYPVVIFVHGGTWVMGDKDYHGIYRGVGKMLARHGVVAVLPNYRLSPFSRFPAHAQDVARAFAWTYRNIAKYGGDQNRIILAGHSAGAHLASIVATDPAYLKAPELKLNARARKSLVGVISVCGVYRIPGPDEFRSMAKRIVASMVGAKNPMAPLLLKISSAVNPFTYVFGWSPSARKDASPLSHVHKGLPPFLLLNAQYEVPGLHKMAEDFEKVLSKDGKVKAEVIDNCTHRSITKELHDAKSAGGRAMLDFIQQYAGRGVAVAGS